MGWVLPLLLLAPGEPEPTALKVKAPDFAGIDTWLNSKPLDWAALKGKVVVVHFWAFG